jgi:hypothetical protein
MTETAPVPAAPKKAKAPALEDQPLTELIPAHFLPRLQEALTKLGLGDADLQWRQAKIPLPGAEPQQTYWQVVGAWPQTGRQFNLYFWEGSLNGAKGFSWNLAGQPPSTLESFMIDERKVTLDLLLLYTLQRLNGQKWLVLW